MTSPLGFKARVGSVLFELGGGVRVTYTFMNLIARCKQDPVYVATFAPVSSDFF